MSHLSERSSSSATRSRSFSLSSLPIPNSPSKPKRRKTEDSISRSNSSATSDVGPGLSSSTVESLVNPLQSISLLSPRTTSLLLSSCTSSSSSSSSTTSSVTSPWSSSSSTALPSPADTPLTSPKAAPFVGNLFSPRTNGSSNVPPPSCASRSSSPRPGVSSIVITDDPYSPSSSSLVFHYFDPQSHKDLLLESSQSHSTGSSAQTLSTSTPSPTFSSPSPSASPTSSPSFSSSPSPSCFSTVSTNSSCATTEASSTQDNQVTAVSHSEKEMFVPLPPTTDLSRATSSFFHLNVTSPLLPGASALSYPLPQRQPQPAKLNRPHSYSSVERESDGDFSTDHSAGSSRVALRQIYLPTMDEKNFLIGRELAAVLRRRTFNLYRSMKLRGVKLYRLSADQSERLIVSGVVDKGCHSLVLIPLTDSLHFVLHHNSSNVICTIAHDTAVPSVTAPVTGNTSASCPTCPPVTASVRTTTPTVTTTPASRLINETHTRQVQQNQPHRHFPHVTSQTRHPSTLSAVGPLGHAYMRYSNRRRFEHEEHDEERGAESILGLCKRKSYSRSHIENQKPSNPPLPLSGYSSPSLTPPHSPGEKVSFSPTFSSPVTDDGRKNSLLSLLSSPTWPLPSSNSSPFPVLSYLSSAPASPPFPSSSLYSSTLVKSEPGSRSELKPKSPKVARESPREEAESQFSTQLSPVSNACSPTISSSPCSAPLSPQPQPAQRSNLWELYCCLVMDFIKETPSSNSTSSSISAPVTSSQLEVEPPNPVSTQSEQSTSQKILSNESSSKCSSTSPFFLPSISRLSLRPSGLPLTSAPLPPFSSFGSAPSASHQSRSPSPSSFVSLPPFSTLSSSTEGRTADRVMMDLE